MINSKQKGAQYERTISRKLSEWVTGSDEEIVFWRNVHSGTTGTIQKKKGKSDAGHTGDFSCVNLDYQELTDKFFIDSKALGDVHLMLINPKNQKSNQLFSQWRKVYDDAMTSKKIPLMLIKSTNDRKIPELVMIPTGTIVNGISTMNYNFNDEYSIYNCIVMTQDEFFSSNNWEKMVKNNL